MMCKWCNELGHIEKACQWKKFAEKFPADMEFGQNEPVTQPADEMIQQPEEMTQANDVPPFTQDSQPDNTEAMTDATHEHDLWKEFPIVPYSFFNENKTKTTNDCDVDTTAELQEKLDGDNQLSKPVFTFLMSNAASPFNVPPEPIHISQQRVQIRIPPPMVLQPNEFIETIRARSRQAGGIPIITSGGRKYITMSNLQAAMGQTSNKKKSEKK